MKGSFPVAETKAKLEHGAEGLFAFTADFFDSTLLLENPGNANFTAHGSLNICVLTVVNSFKQPLLLFKAGQQL